MGKEGAEYFGDVLSKNRYLTSIVCLFLLSLKDSLLDCLSFSEFQY